MANPNPPDLITARMAKAERRRMALSEMLARLSRAGDVAEQLLDHETPEIRLRAVHALTQCATTYARVYEVGELEYRFELLEHRLQTQTATTEPHTDAVLHGVDINEPTHNGGVN